MSLVVVVCAREMLVRKAFDGVLFEGVVSFDNEYYIVTYSDGDTVR